MPETTDLLQQFKDKLVVYQGKHADRLSADAAVASALSAQQAAVDAEHAARNEAFAAGEALIAEVKAEEPAESDPKPAEDPSQG